MTVVAVGAGYTGTEIVAQTHRWLSRVADRWSNIDVKDVRWLLIDVAPAVLPELAEPLMITSDGELVQPVRGQQSPLRGWRSVVDRELLPAWSFGFRVRAEAAATITTNFRFEPSQGA